MFGEERNSSGLRSSELWYSEPSKLNLIACTRLTLKANVARPMTTPISTPAMKPHSRIINAIAAIDRAGTDHCRAAGRPGRTSARKRESQHRPLVARFNQFERI